MTEPEVRGAESGVRLDDGLEVVAPRVRLAVLERLQRRLVGGARGDALGQPGRRRGDRAGKSAGDGRRDGTVDVRRRPRKDEARADRADRNDDGDPREEGAPPPGRPSRRGGELGPGQRSRGGVEELARRGNGPPGGGARDEGGEVFHGGEARVARSLQGPVHGGGHERVEVGHPVEQRRRVRVEQAGDELHTRERSPRELARQQLVGHHAPRELVAAAVEPLGAQLLARHVLRRSHDDALGGDHGQVGGRRGARRVDELGVGAARDAEIEDLGRAVGRDEDVLGLDVAMHQARAVGGAEATRDVEEPGDLLGQGRRGVADEGAQRGALDELHGDERRAVGFPDVVDGHDVRVGEGGGGARLPHHARRGLGVGHRVVARLAEELHGDATPQPRVVRPEDATHAALADHGFEAVTVDGAPHLEGHRHAMVARRAREPPRT